MKTIATAVIGFIVSGCVTPQPTPGTSLADIPAWPYREFSVELAGQIAFDHGCPPERTRVIQNGPNGLVMDLDVCGVVRRYKWFGKVPGWQDVTNLYAASSLPRPLAASLPPPPAAKPQAAEEGADGMVRW